MASSIFIGWFGGIPFSSSGSTLTVTGNLTVTGTASLAGISTFQSSVTGDSETSNFVNSTFTFPASPGTTVNGFMVDATSAGATATFTRAAYVLMRAGYTGAGSTLGLGVTNQAAATATGGSFAEGNFGLTIIAQGNGTGQKIGLKSVVQRSSTYNLGASFQTVTAANSPQHQIGMAAFALNGSSTNVAGYFGLTATEPTLGINCALVADNGAVAAPIATFRDNGTTVVSVDDGGTVTLVGGATLCATRAALTNGAAAQTGTLTNAPAAGNPTKWIGINDNGTVRYVPAW